MSTRRRFLQQFVAGTVVFGAGVRELLAQPVTAV
ncbi:MAG: twin-arginine translocation signal domain-containing protein, partial [Acidobacteria bacterium]